MSYVAQTIDSLIKGMSPEEQDDCLLILFVAEVKVNIIIYASPMYCCGIISTWRCVVF